MPKYVTRNETDIYGRDQIVTRSEPTGYEIAEGVGSAVGAGIGWLIQDHRNTKDKAAERIALRGKQYLANGAYEKALACANKLIKQRDKETQMVGYAIRAWCLEGMGYAVDAIQTYQTTIDLAQMLGANDALSDMLMGRGRCYLDQNNLAGAINDFTAYIRMHPDHDTGYGMLALSLISLGDFDQALNNINRAISLNPGRSTHYKVQAQIYTQQNQHQKALEAESRASKLDTSIPMSSMPSSRSGYPTQPQAVQGAGRSRAGRILLLLLAMVAAAVLFAPQLLKTIAPLHLSLGSISMGNITATPTSLPFPSATADKPNLDFTVQGAPAEPSTEEAMLELINGERTSRGLEALVWDGALREVARSHADDMFKRGYLAHDTPEGVDPFQRMDKANIQYRLAGENLALAPTLEIAHDSFMNSPGDRANILNAQFSKVGIGVLDGGSYGKMFVQEFTDADGSNAAAPGAAVVRPEAALPPILTQPPATPTETYNAVVASTNVYLVNLRSGNSRDFPSLGAVPQGTRLRVIGTDGRGEDDRWLKVEVLTGDHPQGWMRGNLLELTTAALSIPVVETPPAPTRVPTAVSEERLIYGPEDGGLYDMLGGADAGQFFSVATSFSTKFLAVHDFILEVSIINPVHFAADGGSYQFAFNDSAYINSNESSALGVTGYVLRMRGDSCEDCLSLETYMGGVQSDRTPLAGKIDPSDSATNKIRIEVRKGSATISINGTRVSAFDWKLGEKQSIEMGLNVSFETADSERRIEYRDLKVISLDN
ncbi:MAG: hypothetical protein QOH93_208 [Chloroflexia bacterium]|nr:hypothetical protein [Chloroflexia bacterium]